MSHLYPETKIRKKVGAEFSFKGDFLEYLGLENKGIYTCAKEMKEEVLEQVRSLAEKL